MEGGQEMLQNRRLELSRSRAETAFQNVQGVIDKPIAKKYKSLVRKTPMRIKANGLGATLAFVFSKKREDNQHALLYKQLETWLSDNDMVDVENGEFVGEVVAMEKADYRVATNELLAFLTWLRRFVDGMIEGEEDDDT